MNTGLLARFSFLPAKEPTIRQGAWKPPWLSRRQFGHPLRRKAARRSLLLRLVSNAMRPRVHTRISNLSKPNRSSPVFLTRQNLVDLMDLQDLLGGHWKTRDYDQVDEWRQEAAAAVLAAAHVRSGEEMAGPWVEQMEKRRPRNVVVVARAEPNQVFTSNITYIWTDEGWLYLAVTLDLFNREVVGWSVKPRMTTELVTDALTMAWFRRRPAPGALHHSDRGSQYCQPRLPAQTELVRHALLDEP
ncbi:integrase-like protein [Paraburkholderia silvatlantica]|nr:integrase-like protein [Paraburkholderia silvatlantica]